MMYLTSRDLRSIAVLFLSCVACVMAKPAVTRTLAPLEAPVIGILAQATPPPYGVFGNQYIEASYVKYLEMAGARVVTIRGYQTDQYYHTLFDKVLNGVLLPGGMVDIVTSEFARVSKIFYNLAIQANDRGDYFPVWGTCQGFEQLTQLTSGKNLLTRTDSMNMAMSLLMASGWNTSRLLGKAPNDVMKFLQSENVTANFHDWSLLLETYNETQTLREFYRVLSTNWDRTGTHHFVSTMEAVHYPFYGVQWHPEMNIYNWEQGLALRHTAHARRVAQYLASFFVDEARKSSHRSAPYKEIATSVVENDKVFYAWKDMRQVYLYNVTDKAQH